MSAADLRPVRIIAGEPAPEPDGAIEIDVD